MVTFGKFDDGRSDCFIEHTCPTLHQLVTRKEVPQNSREPDGNGIQGVRGACLQPEYSAMMPIASPPTALTRTVPKCQTRMWY